MAKSSSSGSQRRLGRGLSSLIGSSTSQPARHGRYEPVRQLPTPAQAAPVPSSAGPTAQQVAVEAIAPNPYQPRRRFDADELSGLADSIARQGVLQPLIVAPAPRTDADRPYVLVAGERRLRAARHAGLADVPCIIRQASREQLLEWALVENIQRTDLNPLERAEACRHYMDRFGLTQAQVAEHLGQPRASVANYLRILDLCEEVRQLILAGSLSFGHAKVLAGLGATPGRQTALAREVAEKELSVRQLEGLIATQAARAREPKRSTAGRTKPPYIVDLEERLTQAVGTRVIIQPGRAKNSGRLVIEYYSLDDFDRITAGLGLAETE